MAPASAASQPFSFSLQEKVKTLTKKKENLFAPERGKSWCNREALPPREGGALVLQADVNLK